MKRQIVYYGALPQDTDLLNTQKNSYIAMAKLAGAILGTNTIFSGLAATPGSGLNVSIAPGQVFSLESIDAEPYGSLAADTAHQILKQGINLDATTLSVPAPGTSGQSINYLVQAQFQEVDGGAQVLPYYNSANPTVALSGQNNSGQAQATYRDNIVALQVKAGTAAATGSQTTPAADAGWTGLYVVTVNYGDTAIAQAAISTVPGAPFLTNQLYNFANGLTVGGALTGTSATFSGALRAASMDYTPIGQNSPAAGKFTSLDASSTIQATIAALGTPALRINAPDSNFNSFAYLGANGDWYIRPGSTSGVIYLSDNGGDVQAPHGINNTPIGQSAPAAVNGTTGFFNNKFGIGIAPLSGSAVGDLTVARPGTPTTGTIYFGNTGGAYLGFDGSQYNLGSQGPLVATAGINNTPMGQTTPAAGNFTLIKASGTSVAKQSSFGYSSTYKVVQIGGDANVDIALGVDPSTIAGGSFGGNGAEILIKNGAHILAPNSGATDWQSLLSFDVNGKATFNQGMENTPIGQTTPAAGKFTSLGTTASASNYMKVGYAWVWDSVGDGSGTKYGGIFANPNGSVYIFGGPTGNSSQFGCLSNGNVQVGTGTDTGDRFQTFGSAYVSGTVTIAPATSATHAAQLSQIATVAGAFKNLKITNNATYPNNQVSITADELVVENGSSSTFYVLRNVSLPNVATSGTGPNSLDTGTVVANTWYAVWVAYGTSGACGLLSTSSTAPALPSGYTYKARVGYVRTDASGNLMRTIQYGRRAQYVVTPSTTTANLPIMAANSSGNPDTPTWTAVATGTFVPPTASAINAVLTSGTGGHYAAAPNANYGGVGSTTNPAPLCIDSNAAGFSAQDWMLLESSNIYYAANAAGSLACMGWEDNI